MIFGAGAATVKLRVAPAASCRPKAGERGKSRRPNACRLEVSKGYLLMVQGLPANHLMVGRSSPIFLTGKDLQFQVGWPSDF